jgi:hypothetical protein
MDRAFRDAMRHFKAGRYIQAFPEMQLAYDIAEAELGPNHPTSNERRKDLRSLQWYIRHY